MKGKIREKVAGTVLFWSAVAVALAFLLSLFASCFLLQEVIGQGSALYLSWAIAALSVFVSALFCGSRLNGTNRLSATLGVGVLFYLCTVLVKLAVFPGDFQNVWVNLLICVTASSLAALVLTKKKKRRALPIKSRR